MKKKYSLSEKAVYYLGKAVAYDNVDRQRRKASGTSVTKAVGELIERVEVMKGDDIKLTESYINGHDMTENRLLNRMINYRRKTQRR